MNKQWRGCWTCKRGVFSNQRTSISSLQLQLQQLHNDSGAYAGLAGTALSPCSFDVQYMLNYRTCITKYCTVYRASSAHIRPPPEQRNKSRNGQGSTSHEVNELCTNHQVCLILLPPGPFLLLLLLLLFSEYNEKNKW